MKNLKKGLAVAMSLAMIATVVPATKVDATNYCDLDQNKQYDEVLALLEDAGLEIDTMKLADSLAEDAKYKGSGADAAVVATVEDLLTAAAEEIEAYSDCNIRPNDEVADKLKTFETGVTNTEATIKKLEDKLITAGETNLEGSDVAEGDDGEWFEIIPADAGEAAKELMGKLTSDEFVLYLGNVSDKHADSYNRYYSTFETLLDEYNQDNFDSVVTEYLKALDEITLHTNVKVVDFIATTNQGKVDYNKLSAFEKAVDKIKEDKWPTLKAVAKYEDMETEDAVAEIMEALDEAITGMTEVKEIVADAKASITAYKKISGNADVKGVLAAAAVADLDAFEKAIAKLSTSQLETLANYYNNVTSNFYELSVKERANGTYTATLSDTDYVKYASATETAYKSVFANLAKVIERDEETTYLDLLVERGTEISKALEAITTGIKGITVKNLTSANAAKVAAAKAAYDELTTTYKDSLTTAQTKTVKNAANNIEILYTYMLFNGIVAETNNGWVDLGNGAWDYYKDGVAFTGWVAAGSDWYYVKGGHMLRNSWVAKDAAGAVWYYVDNAGKMVSNTTVGGYVINANGEWHK